MEVEALATITINNVQSFVWRSIVFLFGIPRVFFSENGKQFDNHEFREFCWQLGIKNHYSSPAHSQVNGQVEVTNQFLLMIIKTRLKEVKGTWPDELPSLLWEYRTTAQMPTGETPFRLVLGSKAIFPAKIGIKSYRTTHYDEERNKEGMHLHLYMLDEVRVTKTRWPSITIQWLNLDAST